MTFRTERDPLGELNVPADAYYGVQTARAVENFPISGLRAPADLVTATILIKKAAAEANRDLGRLDAAVARRHPDRGRRDSRRASARSVRRRRLPGRRRHLAQHERERGAGQPRRRAARRAARHLRARASERSRQHGTVDQRRVPGGDAAGAAPRTRPARSRRASARGKPRSKKAAAVRAHPEDRPHPPAGCRADHARSGVRRLRRVHSRAVPTMSSGPRSNCRS